MQQARRRNHDRVDRQHELHARQHGVDRVDVAVDLRLDGQQLEHGQQLHDAKHRLDGRHRHRLELGQHEQRHQFVGEPGRERSQPLMPSRSFVLVLAAAMSLGLAACHRDTGAQSSAAANNKPPAGSTGSGGGTAAMGGPGTGLNGGLGQGRPGQQTGVAEGTDNRTPKNNVGSR